MKFTPHIGIGLKFDKIHFLGIDISMDEMTTKSIKLEFYSNQI